MGGHLEAGIFINEYGRKNTYTDGLLDPWSGNTSTLKNVRQSDFQVNQLYFNFGKKVDTSRGFDVGGRIDFMYGTDAVFLQSDGLERNNGHGTWRSGDYYTAIPQLYFEFGYENFNLKFGKFLSLMEVESILSPDRFFYSLSSTYDELPNTLTGIVGEWAISDRFTISGGWVNGENMTFDETENAIVADVFLKWNEHIRLGYATCFNVDSRNKENERYYTQSFVLDYKATRWDYRIEWVLRTQKYGHNGLFGMNGINQELLYHYNKRWSFGARFEWMHRYTRSDIGYDLYRISLGANWRPVKGLRIRPEIRYNRSDNVRIYDKDDSGGGKKGQLNIGLSTIFMF